MELIVTSSPHIRSQRTVTSVMLDVIIALIPTLVAGIYYFGFRSAILVTISCISAVVFEYIAVKLRGAENSIGDLSAVVTGLLLGLNLPPGSPYWIAVVGSAFAVLIVKQVFGGIGQNFMNPAIGARIFLAISFAGHMTNYYKPFTDSITQATPLANLSSGNLPSILDLLMGNVSGVIGETCALALIIGGIYLVVRKVISWHIPVIYISSVFILTALFNGFNFSLAFSSIFAGGLMLGAIFMATDYVTCPVNIKGQCIFALGCGLLTTLIRLFGAYPEGVMFAIALMNICAPLIERYTAPRVFGRSKR